MVVFPLSCYGENSYKTTFDLTGLKLVLNGQKFHTSTNTSLGFFFGCLGFVQCWILPRSFHSFNVNVFSWLVNWCWLKLASQKLDSRLIQNMWISPEFKTVSKSSIPALLLVWKGASWGRVCRDDFSGHQMTKTPCPFQHSRWRFDKRPWKWRSDDETFVWTALK